LTSLQEQYVPWENGKIKCCWSYTENISLLRGKFTRRKEKERDLWRI